MSPAKLPSGISLRIVPRPSVKLAGIRIRTDMQTAQEDVRKLWHEAMPQINPFLTDNGKNDPAYGVWAVDPETSNFDYYAAVKPGRNSVLPEEFEETIIPAGLYAECTVPSRDALYRLYHYLHKEWSPEQEEGTIRDTCFEVYPDYPDKEGHMKLYIPIVGR